MWVTDTWVETLEKLARGEAWKTWRNHAKSHPSTQEASKPNNTLMVFILQNLESVFITGYYSLRVISCAYQQMIGRFTIWQRTHDAYATKKDFQWSYRFHRLYSQKLLLHPFCVPFCVSWNLFLQPCIKRNVNRWRTCCSDISVALSPASLAVFAPTSLRRLLYSAWTSADANTSPRCWAWWSSSSCSTAAIAAVRTKNERNKYQKVSIRKLLSDCKQGSSKGPTLETGNAMFEYTSECGKTHP